jgi:hypothetical protein
VCVRIITSNFLPQHALPSIVLKCLGKSNVDSPFILDVYGANLRAVSAEFLNLSKVISVVMSDPLDPHVSSHLKLELGPAFFPAA